MVLVLKRNKNKKVSSQFMVRDGYVPERYGYRSKFEY